MAGEMPGDTEGEADIGHAGGHCVIDLCEAGAEASMLRQNATASAAYLAADAEVPEPDKEAERKQEAEVRRTAQSILAAHLRLDSNDSEPNTYWRGQDDARMTLNLRDAVLLTFNLARCAPGRTDLTGAQFHGHANVSWAQFYRGANMSQVQFHREANLIEAQFHRAAILSKAQFRGDANLIRVQIDGRLDLEGTGVSRLYGGPEWSLSEEPDENGLRLLVRRAPPAPEGATSDVIE